MYVVNIFCADNEGRRDNAAAPGSGPGRARTESSRWTVETRRGAGPDDEGGCPGGGNEHPGGIPAFPEPGGSDSRAASPDRGPAASAIRAERNDRADGVGICRVRSQIAE